MKNNETYYTNVKENIRTREKFSEKMRYSKYWIRSNAIRNNPQLDDFLTQVYYNPTIRQKLNEGVTRGLTGIESIRDEIDKQFEYLSNSEKQGLGMALAMILSESEFYPTKSVPIYNTINIRNAHLYTRKY